MKNSEEKSKKHILLIGTIIIVAIIFTIGIAVKCSNRKQEGVTRGEWIYNLTEAFQITKYKEEAPYYRDVNTDNVYFDNMQAAYEWGVLESESKFHSDDVATGEFVALTAMKAVGCYKVQVFLKSEEIPDEKDYLKLALEKEVISEEMLEKGVTQEQALEILSRAQDLYYSELWIDNYVNIQYQKNVIQLDSEDIIALNNDFTLMQVNDAIIQKMKVDANVIIPQSLAGRDIARKVTDINEDGTVKLADTELEKVISSFIVSDIERVSLEDIFSQSKLMAGAELYQVMNDLGNVEKDTSISMMLNSVWNIEDDYDGFTVDIMTDDGELKVALSENKTGSSITLSTGIMVDHDTDIKTSVKVKSVDVGVQMIHNGLEVEYANVQVESDISFTGEFNLNSDLIIPICKAPIYLGNGTIGVEIPFYLVLTAEGSVSLEAEMPVTMACEYNKDSGLRANANLDCNVNMEANCKMQCILRIEPILQLSLLGLIDVNVFDAEVDLGIEANASTKLRSNSNIISCTDISLAAPIVSVSFLGDENVASLLRELMSPIDEMRFDIFNAENAFIKDGWHYEVYGDGTASRVKECTYNKEKQESETLSAEDPHNYVVNFITEFEEQEDYYEVTGKVFDVLYIPVNVADNMEIGDSYVYDNVTFTCMKRGVYDSPYSDEIVGTPWLVLMDDKGNYFLVSGLSTEGTAHNNEDMDYYYYMGLCD